MTGTEISQHNIQDPNNYCTCVGVISYIAIQHDGTSTSRWFAPEDSGETIWEIICMSVQTSDRKLIHIIIV